jgi:hypothetical protein
MASVFFIHVVTDDGSGTRSEGTTNNGTGCAVLFIDDSTGSGAYNPTNYSTFGCFAPAFFGLGGIARL